MKYKVLKEYPNYYLCESEFGYKECFDKRYKPQDGIISIIRIVQLGHKIDPLKVNRLWNGGIINDSN